MAEENITGSAPSQNVDDMLASLSSENTTLVHGGNERRDAHRSHVKWHVDIILDDQSIHQGFINDISTMGVSIYLENAPHINKCTLRVHVPPQNLTSNTHVIEVSGQLVYLVYDGRQQLFRAAFNFLSFNPASDLAFLGKCLAQHP
jgi:hypothetical protein